MFILFHLIISICHEYFYSRILNTLQKQYYLNSQIFKFSLSDQSSRPRRRSGCWCAKNRSDLTEWCRTRCEAMSQHPLITPQFPLLHHSHSHFYTTPTPTSISHYPKLRVMAVLLTSELFLSDLKPEWSDKSSEKQRHRRIPKRSALLNIINHHMTITSSLLLHFSISWSTLCFHHHKKSGDFDLQKNCSYVMARFILRHITSSQHLLTPFPHNNIPLRSCKCPSVPCFIPTCYDVAWPSLQAACYTMASAWPSLLRFKLPTFFKKRPSIGTVPFSRVLSYYAKVIACMWFNFY